MLEAAPLLARAARHYDAPGSALPALARTLGWRGFGGAAVWMAAALGEVRGRPPPAVAAAGLGLGKYGLCLAAALAAFGTGRLAGVPAVGALLAIAAFYAVEAQMVFLLPVASDGAQAPFTAARALTRHAGGTLPVMRLVLPIAAAMITGGVRGRGFVRSWAVGALAIVLAYEALRVREGR